MLAAMMASAIPAFTSATLVYLGAGLVAAGLVVAGTVRSALRFASSWFVVAAGLALAGASHALIALSPDSMLSWSTTAASAALSIGVLLLVAERRVARDPVVPTAGLVVLLGGAAAIITLRSGGEVAAPHVAEALVDLLAFVGAFSLWSTRPASAPAPLMLTLGAALRVLASSAEVAGATNARILMGVGIAGLLIMGVAALADDMDRLGQSMAVPGPPGARHRVIITVLGFLAAPVAVGAGLVWQRPLEPWSIAAIAVILGAAAAVHAANLSMIIAQSRVELLRTDARHDDLAVHARDLILTVDDEGMITSVNAAANHLLAQGSGALLGTNLANMIDPKDEEQIVAAMRAAQSGRLTEPIEAVLLDVKARSQTFEFRFSYPSEGSRLSGVVVTASTLSAQKRMEADRSAAHNHPRAISDLGQAALNGATPEALAKMTVDRIARTLDASTCQLYRWQREANLLLLEAAVGPGDGQVGTAERRIGNSSLPGYVAATNKTVQVTDLRSEQRFSDDPDLTNGLMASALGIPIQGSRGVWGVLTVATDRRREFINADVEFVFAMAQSLVLALDRRKAEDETKHAALHDALTGLPNRLLLMERVGKTLTRARTNGTLFGVLFVDLDRFKWVNDNLGHEAGDELLREVARRLTTCMRPDDTVARLGGDEFVILCERLESTTHATSIAERVTAAMEARFQLGSIDTEVTASVGLALADQSHLNADSLLRDADAAMYRAKELGRGRTEVFDLTMRSNAALRHELEAQIPGADDRGEFLLAYQPIVKLSSGRPVGVEALLRWRHPERGTLLPEDFLMAIEPSGTAGEVGKWVLNQACHDLNRWKQVPGGSFGMIGGNLFAAQFDDPGLPESIAELAAALDVTTDHIILDIPEQLLARDIATSVRRVNALRDIGVQVAVDDFGSESIPLALLHKIPFDLLKLDIGLVQRLPDERTLSMIKAIVLVAQSAGIDVLAKGVESADQLELLIDAGCRFAQGFYFAPAMTAAEIGQIWEHDRHEHSPATELAS